MYTMDTDKTYDSYKFSYNQEMNLNLGKEMTVLST